MHMCIYQNCTSNSLQVQLHSYYPGKGYSPQPCASIINLVHNINIDASSAPTNSDSVMLLVLGFCFCKVLCKDLVTSNSLYGSYSQNAGKCCIQFFNGYRGKAIVLVDLIHLLTGGTALFLKYVQAFLQ